MIYQVKQFKGDEALLNDFLKELQLGGGEVLDVMQLAESCYYIKYKVNNELGVWDSIKKLWS